MRRIFTTALGLLCAVALSAQLATVSAKRKRGEPVRFRVRIENIANPDGQTASDGTRWPFAVSPGVYTVGDEPAFFTPGKKAPANGLEAQAEDGNPTALAASLQRAHHAPATNVFNTPVGADAPGAATPGQAYEFTVTATPGERLTFAMMFGQSNDLFYAPEKSIALFDAQGRPVSGDVSNQLILWDAGTEVNQEPGVGPDQAPRQKAPNTGQGENKPVAPVHDRFTYPATSSVLRVTITPEQ